jgi:hypothetical protein
MSHIPPNFLSKKGGQWRKVTLLDLVTLLHNLRAGAEHPEVGFEDAQQTLASLTGKLNKTLLLDPALIESCLWSANLLDERGEFWDAKGRTFEEYVRSLVGPDKFSRPYNLIEKKD